jgi:hypothetical protein
VCIYICITAVLCWEIRICKLENFSEVDIFRWNLYYDTLLMILSKPGTAEQCTSTIPVLKLWFFTMSAKLGLIRICGKTLPYSSLSCGHQLTLNHCPIHIHTIQYSYIQYAFSTSYVNFKNSTENYTFTSCRDKKMKYWQQWQNIIWALVGKTFMGLLNFLKYVLLSATEILECKSPNLYALWNSQC